MGKEASSAAAAVEKLYEGKKKKGKKKGRPSLLDIQKRYLRLQRQHELELERQQQLRRGQRQSPSPNPSNPHLRPSPTRRSSQLSPDSAVERSVGGSGDDDEEVGEGARTGRRRQRKLRVMMRLSPSGWRDGELEALSSGSEGDGRGAVKKRRIEAIVGPSESETDKQRSALKPTQAPRQGEPTVGGTPLPDKQLLVFILDRLQKKDTYGVFSEPVDPDELPDYHDVIEFPMDFSTIRKKLSRGSYANLEEFEDDVFLICLNAMRYNAPDTIYFRQARTIQELAKKDFENLRQDSDDSELESKPVRTSRIFVKDVSNKIASRSLAEHDLSNDSTVPIPTNNDHQFALLTGVLSKVIDSDKCGITELPGRALQKPLNGINHTKIDEHKSHKFHEYSGVLAKDLSRRCCRKITLSEENRWYTDKQTSAAVCGFRPSVLSTFDEEKKELITVGVHVENAYARSLARFAAKFGPIGWDIAVSFIKRSLPPGTKFGRGWVGEKDVSQQSRPPVPSKISSGKSTTSLFASETCEPKRPTGKLAGSSSLMTVVKRRTSPEVRLSSPTEIVTTQDPNKVEHDIVIKPDCDNTLNTGTVVQSNVHVSHPNGGSLPADNGSAENTTRSLGLTSKASEIPENAAMINMVFEGNNNSIRPVDANFAYFPSRTSKTSKINEEKVNPGGPSPAVNFASNSFQSKAMIHMESETRANYSGTLNSIGNFIRQSSSRILDRGTTNSPSPHTTKSVENLAHPAVIGPLETEKVQLNNQRELNHGNNFFCSSRTGRLEEDGVGVGNADTCSGDCLLQPTAKVLFESELAKLGTLGFMNSRRLLNLAAAGSIGERTETNGVRMVDSGSTVVEWGKDFASRPSQGLQLSQNAHSIPPDLNIRFQSPSSPTTAIMVDSQQPDLALQL